MQHASITKIDQLMLFGEIIVDYFENYIVTILDSLARVIFKMAFIAHSYSTATAKFN
jgi:hypothetical protein